MPGDGDSARLRAVHPAPALSSGGEPQLVQSFPAVADTVGEEGKELPGIRVPGRLFRSLIANSVINVHFPDSLQGLRPEWSIFLSTARSFDAC